MGSPLETRGSIFDSDRQNGVLVGYVRDTEDRSPVVEIIHRDKTGHIKRTRYPMDQVIASLEKQNRHD